MLHVCHTSDDDDDDDDDDDHDHDHDYDDYDDDVRSECASVLNYNVCATLAIAFTANPLIIEA
eukprot:63333-Amphidinium_carterae.1